MLERTPGDPALPPVALAARDRMRDYVRQTARERRTRPGDDLMTHLVRAQAAGELDADELLGSSLLLFVAGITTTSGLISNSLYHLARFPDQREAMQRDPATLPVAIEELLRFDAPIQALARTVTRDVELHGSVIPAGARVALLWASANRDERHWPDPDVLDVTRTPQRHVSFGEGIHHCLGAPLARLEARIVFEELLRADPGLRGRGPDRAHPDPDRPSARAAPRRLLTPAGVNRSRAGPPAARANTRRIPHSGRPRRSAAARH